MEDQENDVSETIIVQDCPGLRCGGSGECVMAEYVCDLDVDCLDNGDVKYCTMVNDKM